MPDLHLIICDDIRHEKSGQSSYIGVYGGEIACEQFPQTFAKLCFCIDCDVAKDTTINSMEVELSVPGQQTASIPISEGHRVSGNASKANTKSKNRNHIEIVANQIVISEPGTIHVRMRINKRYYKAGSVELVEMKNYQSPTRASDEEITENSKGG